MKVTFHVRKGGESVPAKEAAKILNVPTKEEKNDTLGFEVGTTSRLFNNMFKSRTAEVLLQIYFFQLEPNTSI